MPADVFNQEQPQDLLAQCVLDMLLVGLGVAVEPDGPGSGEEGTEFAG